MFQQRRISLLCIFVGSLVLYLWLVAAVVGAASKTIAQSSSPLIRASLLHGNNADEASIWGHYPSGGFGSTLVAGDVNGDGFDDLITSARAVPADFPGEVYVIPGPLEFNQAYTMPVPAALIFQGTPDSEPQVGVYLDSGDINGDGLDDIVMGGSVSGTVSVYLGSSNIQSASLLTVAVSPENMALTITPADSGFKLCDFNADGYEDLFVQDYSDPGIVKVWGLLGRHSLTMTQPITISMPFDADIVIQDFHPADWTFPNGPNMACGDIDGDDIPDLAIGIYSESESGYDGGIVYVLRGDANITIGSPVTLTMPGQAGAIIEGAAGANGTSGDRLGWSLVSDDINLDGRADLILGAPGASGPNTPVGHAGQVYLWLGRALVGQRFLISSQASWTVYGEDPTNGLGAAIAAGDFDNDGYSEILLGCGLCASQGPPTYRAGRGYVLEPLQIGGQIRVNIASRLEINPYSNARCLGSAVAAVDLSGDSKPDLAIGAPCTYTNQDNLPGTVFLLSYPSNFEWLLPVIHR